MPVLLPCREGYIDRHEAGKRLARSLAHLVGRSDVIVLGLPRGGVPVASEVAQALGAPLDIFIVRRLQVPEHPGVAIGAIASGGIRVLDRELVTALGVTWPDVDAITRAQQQELLRRELAFRNGRRPLSLTNRLVVLVDDGLRTGATMRAAVQAVRALKPAAIVVAVPVAAVAGRDELCGLADQVFCPVVASTLDALDDWYDEFPEVTDAEVRGLLGLTSVAAQPAALGVQRRAPVTDSRPCADEA